MAHTAPRPGCGERAPEDSCLLRGAPGLGHSQAGDLRALGGGTPGRGACCSPLPRRRCSWCLGLPPAAGDAPLGRLLVPPPGCADTWDATSLGSWVSELIPLGPDPVGPHSWETLPRDARGVGGPVGRAFPTPGTLRKKLEGRERASGRAGKTRCAGERRRPGPVSVGRPRYLYIVRLFFGEASVLSPPVAACRVQRRRIFSVGSASSLPPPPPPW